MFGWLRPRCPIDPGAKRWTEDRLGWLLGQFGRERLLNATRVVPARQFFPDRYDNSEHAARALFDRTCAFMGIDPAGVELEFYQPTHRPGLARSLIRSRLPWIGQFRRREGINLVQVDVTLQPLPELLIAVFAHELSHQLLLGSNRICEEDLDHELVTDLTTVVLGMGVFNANISLRDRYRLNRRGDEIGGAGYLTPTIWGYALALCAWLRDENKPEWGDWIRPTVRRIFHRSLAYLQRTRDAEVDEGGRLDVDSRVSLLSVEYPGFANVETVLLKRPDLRDEELGEDQDSQTDLDDAIKVDPKEADSVEMLFEGSQHVEAGQWSKAYEVFSEVIRIDPENGTAYQQRALVLIELGMIDAALQDAESAVRLEPDDSESYLARGATYIKVGQFEQAIADLTHYVREEDVGLVNDKSGVGRFASRGYYLRGLAYSGLCDFHRAINDYGRAIQRWPDWPEPYEARADAYETLGNSKLARADRDQARRRATP